MLLPPITLTIAGSDSSAGAGIQADLKTFHRFGVYGTTVVTAVTAQNTCGVAAWESVSPELVRAQIEAVVRDLRPAALKSGMLATDEIVKVVARSIRDYQLAPYVLDPVMVASSGDRLLREDAVALMRRELVPLAQLLTPNLDEAELLLGDSVRDVPAMERAARDLAKLGAAAVLVKGGHLVGDESVDVLFDGTALHVFRHRRIDTTSTHGTGCTLSAAITALLATGTPLHGAIARGLDFVHAAIAGAPAIGRGHGPLNHWT